MAPPPVTVLMATRNGAPHLPEQLGSIAAQQGVDWRLVASDDGSADDTPAILSAFAAAHPGRVTLRRGPGRGAAANFLSMLPAAGARAVAFVDQDDLWLPDKLAHALEALAQVPAGRPALYGCRTIRMTEDGRDLDVSPRWRHGPSFANALVQNVVGGHSAVLNPEGARLLARLSAGVSVPFHDWWAYQVIAGCGGSVILDDRALLRYRQHGGNLLGANRGGGRIGRLAQALGGGFAPWFAASVAALQAVRLELDPEAARLLDRFTAIRGQRGPAAGLRLWQSGIHRQSHAETLILCAAAALGRI